MVRLTIRPSGHSPMLITQQIFLIGSLLCLLTFLLQLSVAAEGLRGTRAMLLSSVLGMAGNALYAFGRELPPLLAYEAANGVYAAAGAALLASYRGMAGRPARLPWLAGSVIAMTALIAIFHDVLDSFAARSVVVSLFQAGVCSAIAHSVLVQNGRVQRPGYAQLFVLAMCGIVALGHSARIGWLALTDHMPGSLLQPDAVAIAFLTAATVALPALALGGLLMAHRRIVRRAEFAANHDHLTGAWSRKAYYDIAAREMARAQRSAGPLALLLIDLDHFKHINDTQGHEAGDAALVNFVRTAQGVLRGVDCLARLGGDEFALLLPDTSLSGAAAVGAKLQQRLERDLGHPGPVRITLSIGVTTHVPGEDWKTTMARCDAALYDAKAAGRNRVACRAPDLRVAAALAVGQ